MNVPKANGHIVTPGGYSVAIGRKGKDSNVARMAVQNASGFSSANIPDARRLVLPGGNQEVAVRAKCNRSHGRRVPAKDPRDGTRLRVANDCCAVPIC